MTMTKREKVLVSIVLVMAVICLYFLMYLKPNMDELTMLNGDISDKESLSSSVAQQKQIIVSVDKAIEENEAKIMELNDGIAIGFDQPAILVYLEKTVSEHARKLTFSFNDMRQSGQLYVCPVSINMLSSYKGLKDLLAAFNDSAYFIKVVSVSVGEPERQVPTSESENAEVADAQAPQPTPAISTPIAAADEKSITLDVEFYGQPGELEAGKDYDFAKGYEYGGDIFN